jgi:hypothetical protein
VVSKEDSESAGAKPVQDASGLLALINGVLVGIGGLYISTRSLLVTFVAASVALLLSTTLIVLRR